MDNFITPAATEAAPRQSFTIIYAISAVFVFHTLLTAYSSSTYLEQFISAREVSLLYALGSLLSMGLFLYITPPLRHLGNVRTTLLLMGLGIASLCMMGMGIFPLVFFVLFITTNPALYLTIDIFSESRIGDHDHETGRKRGLTLSLMAGASVLAPLVMGAVVGDEPARLSYVYFLAAVVGLVFMFVVAAAFRHFKDPAYTIVSPYAVFTSLRGHRHLRGVIAAHFLLQFFFSWIVIYFPLYLATELSLPWSTIGTIIATGLVAYVVCEYPIGILADRYRTERIMMAVGFVILALSSASISFTAGLGVLGWMVVMFLSRVGASLVEVTTESFFFKHVDSTDAPLISFFRITRPAANVVGAATGSLFLLFLPFPLLFILLGLIMVLGIIFSSYIVHEA